MSLLLLQVHALSQDDKKMHSCPHAQLWDRWSQPYIMHMVRKVKAKHPDVPLTLYAMGSGGLVERLGSTGVDVVGLDWMVDMADARARLGPAQTVQVVHTHK